MGDKMKEIQAELAIVPYFRFERVAFSSEPERIQLPHASSIDELTKAIESGKNLFNIIPGFDKQKLYDFRLKNATFETRKEIIHDGTRFFSEDNYTTVGKIFVPDYFVMSRNDIRQKLESGNIGLSDINDYTKTLSRHRTTELFHGIGANLKPLEENMYVLQSCQL